MNKRTTRRQTKAHSKNFNFMCVSVVLLCVVAPTIFHDFSPALDA